jgi:hypothetical protein
VPELFKFLVMVEGVDCSGLAFNSAEGIVRPVGFFTTRFVQATGTEQAGHFALEIVQHEIASMGGSCSLSVSKIRRDDRAYDLHAPGKGFTWY